MLFFSFFAKGQLEFRFSDLPPYTIKEKVVQVKKLVIMNTGKTCKVISLINKPEITGISHLNNDFQNLTMFVSEYGNTLRIENPDEYIPGVYGTWFKKIEIGAEFTIYFFSAEKKSDNDLVQLIRIFDRMCHYAGTNILGYKGDEIIIPLYEP